MKTKKIPLVILIIVSITLMAAYSVNKKISKSNSNTDEFTIELISAAYSSDVVAVEYTIEGEIDTPDGIADTCPVGKTSIISSNGSELEFSDDDYMYCRNIEGSKYLISQFIYHDFTDNENKPNQLKISIGDIDFISETGDTIHVTPIGDYILELPQESTHDALPIINNFVETSNGLKMRVNRADFTKSHGKIDACITLPDNGDWVFDAYMIVDGKKIPFEYWFVNNFREAGTFDTQERCYSTIITDIPDYDAIKNGQVSFYIEKFSRNMPDCVQEGDFNKIKDELAKFDITLEPDAGGNYCFASAIQKIEDPEINAHLSQFIRETLHEEIEGPLEVTIN